MEYADGPLCILTMLVDTLLLAVRPDTVECVDEGAVLLLVTEYRVFRMDVCLQLTFPSLSGSFFRTSFFFIGSGFTPDLQDTTLIFLLPENPESLVVSLLTHSGAGSGPDLKASFVSTSGVMFSVSARDLLAECRRVAFWSSPLLVVRMAIVAVLGRRRSTLDRFGEDIDVFLGGVELVVVEMDVLDALSWSAR